MSGFSYRGDTNVVTANMPSTFTFPHMTRKTIAGFPCTPPYDQISSTLARFGPNEKAITAFSPYENVLPVYYRQKFWGVRMFVLPRSSSGESP